MDESEVVVRRIPLRDEDFALFSIPATRPILVRPADAEWEVGFACLDYSPNRQIEQDLSSKPIVVITKTGDASLPRQLGLSKDDTEFWWMHDSVDQIHGDGSLKLLEKYLTSDAERTAALRAAQESMMAWQVYFDGFYYEGLRRTAAKN